MNRNKKAPVLPGANAKPVDPPASYPPVPPQTTDRPAWTAAKNIGNEGERRVADVLRAIGLLVKQEHGPTPHDLTISGRIEVKNDRAALRTGNIAIEVQHRGRPSGVTNSSASGWAFVLGDEVLLMPTAALRDLMKSGNYRMALAGENAVVVLVPVVDVRRIARSIAVGQGVRS